MEVATQMLLNGFKRLYGLQFFTSNLHNLCHVVDDVKRFGPLDTFSAYPFESRLYYLKRLVRTGANPLAQVARRISEAQSTGCFQKRVQFEKPYELKSELDSDIEEVSLVMFLSAQKAVLLTKIEFCHNKSIFMKSSEIMALKCVIRTAANGIFLHGAISNEISNFFVRPVESKLNIFNSNCIEGNPKFYPLEADTFMLFRK